MSWAARLRDLPLRAKLILTVGGTVVALLGASTYFTFRYWERQALEAAEQQALLAARSVQASVEAGLAYNERAQVHRNLRQLTGLVSLTHARVYGPDGTIVLSADPAEEDRRAPGVWIPDPTEMPSSGLVRRVPDGTGVRAFLPLTTPNAAVFEVRFSVAPVKAAMQRGARLGLGLVIASLVAVGVILWTMLEREVVSPIERLEDLLAESGEEERPAGRRPEDELDRISFSVQRLLEKEQEAERLAEARHRRLAQQEGLVQVGELAAEMAHELKRPLVTIETAVDLLEQEYQVDERGGEMFERVEEQLDKLSETMGDLFSLARPVELEGEPVDLREVADEALMEFRGDPASEDVRVDRQYGDELPRVRGDARRLQQALRNLLVNASEALDGEGEVTVALEARDGEMVELRVADTGQGIPEEEIPEVTRPFYSTKPMGTGLGLPLVARIVAAHEGELAIESTPGEGTTVRIWLPARSRVAEGTASHADG